MHFLHPNPGLNMKRDGNWSRLRHHQRLILLFPPPPTPVRSWGTDADGPPPAVAVTAAAAAARFGAAVERARRYLGRTAVDRAATVRVRRSLAREI